MYFEWKDEFSVNIAQIDEQHQRLFEIGARINDLAYAKDGFDHYDDIMQVIHELREYTEFHFDHEEKMMEKYGYERFEAQKFEHHFVIKKIQKFENSDIDERQDDTILGLVSFVSDWISSHILKEDMKYREFFNNKGVF